MEEASKMFVGYHDFRTFMNKHFEGSERITRKYIDSVKIVKRQLPGYSDYSWPSFVKSDNEQYFAIDIYIKGPSFLYRQVSFFLHNCFKNSRRNLKREFLIECLLLD